jgi:hypothetical protein
MGLEDEMATKDSAALNMEPQQEAPEAEGGERERSTIAFPYLDLDDAVEVAKAVHTVGGSSCQWDQLAAQLGAAAKGGGFRMRVQTAKMFGYLTYDRGSITLSESGKRLSDGDQEKAARVEGFLTIPLYNKIYEQFKGGTLPPPAGLETAMVNLGVAQKQKDKARQVFQRSATQAGFFAFGNSKLVMPSIKASAPAAAPAVVEPDAEPEKKKKKEKDDDESRRLHPLIEGLLKELPEPKTEWPLEDRRNWLDMVSSIFNVIYKTSDDNRGSLKVIVEKNSSAK